MLIVICFILDEARKQVLLLPGLKNISVHLTIIIVCYLLPLVDKKTLPVPSKSLCCYHVCSCRCLSVCLSVFRSSRAVLQFDVVPQSRPRPHVYPSDWLGQRPLHSAMGQEETLHPGSVHRNADRSGAVSERIADR